MSTVPKNEPTIVGEDGLSRRKALRQIGTGGLAAAAAGLVIADAQATPARLQGDCQFSGARIEATLQPEVSVADLTRFLEICCEYLVEFSGCTACGLLGIDELVLRPWRDPDPEPFLTLDSAILTKLPVEQFQGVEQLGVEAVLQMPGG